mmetsp:Transcript_21345/g.42641  ORF Transcript_21345/g.42641 Transcript_21345/m.42641 type:complete len:206 (+) Transcript_21345:209-826(+)
MSLESFLRFSQSMQVFPMVLSFAGPFMASRTVSTPAPSPSEPSTTSVTSMSEPAKRRVVVTLFFPTLTPFTPLATSDLTASSSRAVARPFPSPPLRLFAAAAPSTNANASDSAVHKTSAIIREARRRAFLAFSDLAFETQADFFGTDRSAEPGEVPDEAGGGGAFMDDQRSSIFDFLEAGMPTRGAEGGKEAEGPELEDSEGSGA